MQAGHEELLTKRITANGKGNGYFVVLKKQSAGKRQLIMKVFFKKQNLQGHLCAVFFFVVLTANRKVSALSKFWLDL